MASRQGMIRTTIALGIAFALGAPLTASAQAAARSRPRYALRRGAPPAGAQGGGRGPRWRSTTLHARGRRPGPALGAP